MHLIQPPFVPRVKENQSITKYFEDEKDIITDGSSSYSSLRERLECNEIIDDHHAKIILGNHFERWKKECMEQEKHELGIEDCSDGELQRIKEHFGAEYEIWKAERIIQLQEQHLGEDAQCPLLKTRKEKRRPRDKLLRDPIVGRKAMELRKRGAFFGYTYRRPRTPVLQGGWAHTKDAFVRPTIMSVHAHLP